MFRLPGLAIGLLANVALLTMASGVFAQVQRSGNTRPSDSEIRREINNETLRDLINEDARNPKGPADNSSYARALLLKKVRDDFKMLQSVNNKMMSEAWAREEINYGQVTEKISEIHVVASRLKTNLSLPQPDDSKKKEQALAVGGARELRSALLLMDRSITNFVANPVFQSAGVIEINSAARAAQDLDDVIFLSSNLKKAIASLKHSAATR